MKRLHELNDPVRVINLKNDIQISFYDLSKKIAADRWLVRICCIATLKFQDKMLKELSADLEIINAFKDRYANGLNLEVIKERNFIDESEKDDILKQLFSQIDENSLEYMGGPIFPMKLLKSKFKEFNKEYIERKQMQVVDDIEEDDGTADFSACFRD